MIVKTPLKKQRVRPNYRKNPTGINENTLNNGNGQSSGSISSKKRKLPTFKPWKFILGIILIGVLGFFYLNHVFATQKLLREVQQLENEFNKAKSKHDELKLQYDRMTGPAVIYEKAKELGFINGGPADQIINVED